MILAASNEPAHLRENARLQRKKIRIRDKTADARRCRSARHRLITRLPPHLARTLRGSASTPTHRVRQGDDKHPPPHLGGQHGQDAEEAARPNVL